MFPEEEEFTPRVRAVRDSSGRVVGFQDPDQGNRFISRADAINRLKYSPQQGQILDSFGNPVGVGALQFPGRGLEIATTNKILSYQRAGDDPMLIKVRSNQELVEQITLINKDGSLTQIETSYGHGKGYDPTKRGGWFRQKASEALGVPASQRLTTSDLYRSVARRDFIVKTVSQ